LVISLFAKVDLFIDLVVDLDVDFECARQSLGREDSMLT